MIIEESVLPREHLKNTVDKIQHPENQLFVISARDKAAANAMIANLRAHIKNEIEKYHSAASFVDLAHTLCERRSRFPWIATVTASNAENLLAALTDNSSKPVHNITTTPRLGFVFNGQGAQWPGMGRELESAYPVYAKTLQECDRIVSSFGAEWSLIGEFSFTLSCIMITLILLIWNRGTST